MYFSNKSNEQKLFNWLMNTCSNSLKYEHPTENKGFEIFVFWPQTTSNSATSAVLDLKPKMILQMDFFML